MTNYVGTNMVGDILRGIIGEAANEYRQTHPLEVEPAPEPEIKELPILKTRKEKLNWLIEIMEDVKLLDAKRFNMYSWVTKPEYMECGFAGCCLGWATTDPIFKKMGLESLGNGIRYGECHDLEAGMAFFGLYESEAEFLFLPEEYYLDTACMILVDFYPNELFYKNKNSKISVSRVINRIKYVKNHPLI